MSVKLYEGDNRVVLREMAERGELVDSVFTDPPYGLVSVTKRFGKDGSKAAKHGRDGAFARQSRGFMGKQWDGTAIERDPEFWRLVYNVMKPGAYIVAFSSSRTYHHMAVAIEAAGFVTHPMIGWVFGSGFPKAHNAAMAIDKQLGAKGSVNAVGEPVRRIRPGADQHKDGSWEKLEDRVYQPGSYEPATPEAAQWQGWAYGGQARKPALEPIYVGQKPFSEPNGAANILKHGVGAVNIDGCRVPTSDNLNGGAYSHNASSRAGNWQNGDRSDGQGSGLRNGSAGLYDQPTGRYPANLILDGSDEIQDLFPHTKSGKPGVMRKGQNDGACYGAESRAPGTPMTGFGDEGSAARFFETYPFDSEPIFYRAKANKQDRAGSRHPTVKPISLNQALIRHITPPGGLVLDPFAGSGTTGAAALAEGMRAVLIEMEAEYAADIRRRLNLPVPASELFTDLLGEALPEHSTQCRMSFEDLLG